MMIRNTLLWNFCFIFLSVNIYSQGSNNEVISSCPPYVPESNPNSSTVNYVYESVNQIEERVNNINYGVGSGKLLQSFTTNSITRRIQRIATPQSKFYVRRNNINSQIPRDNLYIETTEIENNLQVSYPRNVEDFFSKGYINAGIDNAFANTGSQSSNAERYDIIFENGYKVIDPQNELILVTERGMNNNILIAVIKEINGNNEPIKLGNVVTVNTNKMYRLISGLKYKIIRRDNVGQNYMSAQNNYQDIGLSVVSYKDLGVAANETVYGYVLLPSDYNTTGANALEYTKFPTDTDDNTEGGHDIGIIYGVFTACDNYVCYNSEINTSPGIPTNHGITLLNRAGAKNDNWPMVRNSGFTVIESNNNGFVPTRMTKIEIEGNQGSPSKISNPQEGMMIFDTTEKCLKIYDGEKWSCFSIQTCP